MTHCPFCTTERERIAENELAFAIYDGFPVNPGHALITPKRHVANFFELTSEERMYGFCAVFDREITLSSLRMSSKSPNS